jgi:L-histidine N-alpha-methyltransferase
MEKRTSRNSPSRTSDDARVDSNARGSIGEVMQTIAVPTILEERQAFALAAQRFLQCRPRRLPSRFLYDALGSALFDAICHLPWYRVTRAELRLLRRHATTIGQLLRDGVRVVELGCGNGEKLATLLTHANAYGVHAHLIDLSEAALAQSVQTLATVAGSTLRVTTDLATYEDGLLALPRENAVPTLIALLGSNIGNFDRPEAEAFVGLIRATLYPGDYLLLGADLVKPERELLLAYDDPLGLTAAFNKNLLLRMNTELGASFVIDRFAHRAVWNRDASRVEMHIVSLVAQDVEVAAAKLRFRLDEGETIWTESSYKFEPLDISQLVEPAGFVQRSQWIDVPGRFALTLFEAI